MTETNKVACAPSEDSDQPGHLHCLIRVFAARSVGSLGSKLSSCGQRRLRSDWANAQSDLSLRWAHMPFCWLCHAVAHYNTGHRYENFASRKHAYIMLTP